jgi:hypothetical protein
MPKFKDKDEFLDKLFEHMGLSDEDEDQDFFDHVAKFFDDDSGNSGDNNSGNPPAPRRRRRQGQSGGTPPRRRTRQTSDSGYGNSSWFGS